VTIPPSALPDLPLAIMGQAPQPVSIRYGRVVAHRYEGLVIDVAGGQFTAGFVASYEPMIGDVVAVARQGATWLVLGTLGAAAGDSTAVPNYSFEEGAVGAPPPRWQLVTSSGSVSLLTDAYTRSDFSDGRQVARWTCTASGSVDCEVVSDAIPVEPGEQWAVAASLSTDTFFLTSTALLARVYAAWYSTSSLGSLVSQNSSGDYAVTRGMRWKLIRSMGTDGWAVPGAARWLRVKIQILGSAALNDRIYIDRVLARRA
jgi:hypothetical protein